LRLRVVADPATIDPRFLATAEKLDRIAALVARLWPERIAVEDLADLALWRTCLEARTALCTELGLEELEAPA
jgi:succinylarginine dihydrolase